MGVMQGALTSLEGTLGALLTSGRLRPGVANPVCLIQWIAVMQGELSSLEEALGALLTSGQLRPGVIKALWAIAGLACQQLATSGGSDQVSRAEARGCFAVLAAASEGHPQHVATNLNLLIQVILS